VKEFQEQLLKRLDRVADTFDRLATVLTLESKGERYESTAAPRTVPLPAVSRNPVVPAPEPAASGPAGFTFAESGEEYQQRQSRDAAFAISLGVAPWSRDFQTTIMQMKYDLMRPHTENRQDAEGNYEAYEAEGRSEEEAEQIVRDAFKIARAEANVRQGAALPT
jgi:hypothetical protein